LPVKLAGLLRVARRTAVADGLFQSRTRATVPRVNVTRGGIVTAVTLYGPLCLWRIDEDRDSRRHHRRTRRNGDDQLDFYLRRGVESGLTRDQIAEGLTHPGFYAGWSKATKAMTALTRTLGQQK
jgi:hypothetical protein